MKMESLPCYGRAFPKPDTRLYPDECQVQRDGYPIDSFQRSDIRRLGMIVMMMLYSGT